LKEDAHKARHTSAKSEDAQEGNLISLHEC